jgi:hypothetical protein
MSYTGGWLLIFKQAGIFFAPPVQTNETLIWVAGLLIGVPGLAQLIAWRMGETPTGIDGGQSSGHSSLPQSSSPMQPHASSEVE